MKSDAWHAPRIGRITGSRVGKILGLSKYGTRADVVREMVREHFRYPREFDGNDATRYGEEHEPDAITAYAFEHDMVVTQTGDDAPFCPHLHHDWLGVRPDGFVSDDGLIEVKCPYRAQYQSASADYMAQVQLQLECTGSAWCDFVIWRENVPLIVQRIERDPDWLQNHMLVLEAFMAEYHAIISDKKLAATYLEPATRTDDDWRALADTYTQAMIAHSAATERLEAVKKALIDAAPQGAKGCGITLSRAIKSGTVQYAKALKALAPDADMTPWTGEPSAYYQVRVLEG